MKLQLSFMLTSGLVHARFQWNAGLVFFPDLEQHCVALCCSDAFDTLLNSVLQVLSFRTKYIFLI